MTPFGKYLEKKTKTKPVITPAEAAEAIGKSKQYVYMLIEGKVTPSFKLAWEIEVWSKGEVTMQTWAKYINGRKPEED
jgi:DNA-binding XRE family transcriptional regulator